MEQERLLKKQKELERKKNIEEVKNYLLDLNLDFDTQELLNFRDRCVLMGIDEVIDDFIYISKSGEISSMFHIFLLASLEKKLDVLNIPEGIEILLSYDKLVDINIPIIFPSSLKSFTTLYNEHEKNWRYTNGLINFNFEVQPSSLCKFDILDLSKCKNLTHIGDLGFSNIEANKVIFPESLSHIDEKAFLYSHIKELVFNSKVTVNSNVFMKANIDKLILPGVKGLYYKAFDGAEGVNGISDIVIYKDTKVERDSLNGNIVNLYLPLLKNNFQNGITNYIHFMESVISKQYKNFTSDDWNAVLNLLGQYTSIDRSNASKKEFILQGYNKIISRSDIDDLIDITGLQFNLGTFFFLDPCVDGIKDEDNMFLMLNYLSNYWCNYVNKEELDFNKFNIYIYDSDEYKYDSLNDDMVKNLNYTYVTNKLIAMKGSFSVYLEESIYNL